MPTKSTAGPAREGTVVGETSTEPLVIESKPSSFTTRRVEREAREAAGETQRERVPQSFRAGADVPQPVFEVTRVRA